MFSFHLMSLFKNDICKTTYRASAMHSVPVCSPAFAGIHCTYSQKDGQELGALINVTVILILGLL